MGQYCGASSISVVSLSHYLLTAGCDYPRSPNPALVGRPSVEWDIPSLAQLAYRGTSLNVLRDKWDVPLFTHLAVPWTSHTPSLAAL
jgi:hypothetical protein